MRIFARGSPRLPLGDRGRLVEGIAPCWMRIPIRVAVRLLPIDQLSSGVVIVIFGLPLGDDLTLVVTTKAAVIPAGSKAASMLLQFDLVHTGGPRDFKACRPSATVM